MEIKTLRPRKLFPPAEVIAKIKENKAKMLPKNPILRFLKLFFGEGI